MTKEELKKESEEWVKKEYPTLEINAVAARYCKAYLAGAEPREKRIAELEHQLVHRNCLDCSNHSSNLRMRNLELEKENEQIKNSDTLCKLIGEQKRKITELEQQIEKMKSIGRTSYIKGIRTMANALKDYDRTDGAWTDYFEHTVDKVLRKLLKEIKEK